MPKLSITQIAARIMQHAEQHYEEGWDVVVECYDEPMIAAELQRFHEEYGTPLTLKAAMSHFGLMADVHQERYNDARNSAF